MLLQLDWVKPKKNEREIRKQKSEAHFFCIVNFVSLKTVEKTSVFFSFKTKKKFGLSLNLAKAQAILEIRLLVSFLFGLCSFDLKLVNNLNWIISFLLLLLSEYLFVEIRLYGIFFYSSSFWKWKRIYPLWCFLFLFLFLLDWNFLAKNFVFVFVFVCFSKVTKINERPEQNL